MMIKKTFATLFKKPLILILMTAMTVFPYFFAVLISNSEEVIYKGSVVFFSLLFTFLLIGFISAYTYDVCSGNEGGGLLVRGIRNSVKIVPVILIVRLLVRLLTGAGFGATIFYGTQMYMFIIFGAAIATTFEAVAKVSIAATDGLTNALDHAISVSKNIYLKIAVISFVFGVIQIILFLPTESEPVQYYIAENEEIEYAGDYIETDTRELVNTFGYRLSVVSSDFLYALFDAFTRSFILVYCAHHFVEDKRLNDAALERLTWKENEGY